MPILDKLARWTNLRRPDVVCAIAVLLLASALAQSPPTLSKQMKAGDIEIGKLYTVEFFGIGKARVVKVTRVPGKNSMVRLKWVDPPDHERERHGVEFEIDSRQVREPA